MGRIVSFAAVIVALAAGGAPAQVHVVQTFGSQFIDTVSGTSVTTVTLGTIIEWQNTDGIGHTVTSGTGTSDPNSGALFNGPLTNVQPTFQYMPTQVGTIPYYCIPHAFLGMTGTIHVNAPPPSTYPGSGEDFHLGTGINGQPTFFGPNEIKTASAGDVLTTRLVSFQGTFDFSPILLGAQLFLPPNPPIGVIPNLWVNAQGGVLLVDAYAGAPLGIIQVLQPGGNTYSFQLPPGVTGVSIMLQAVAVAPGVAANGAVALSSGHEIQMM